MTATDGALSEWSQTKREQQAIPGKRGGRFDRIRASGDPNRSMKGTTVLSMLFAADVIDEDGETDGGTRDYDHEEEERGEEEDQALREGNPTLRAAAAGNSGRRQRLVVAPISPLSAALLRDSDLRGTTKYSRQVIIQETMSTFASKMSQGQAQHNNTSHGSYEKDDSHDNSRLGAETADTPALPHTSGNCIPQRSIGEVATRGSKPMSSRFKTSDGKRHSR